MLSVVLLPIFLLLSPYKLTAEGFVAGTLVFAANGMQSIETIQKEDLLVTEFGTNVPVVQISRRIVDTYVELSVAQERICCHEMQKLFSADRNAFIQVQELTVDEQLLTFDGDVYAIHAIKRVAQEAVVYGLSVPYPHYLWIGKHKILAHNIAPAVAAGFTIFFGAGAVEFVPHLVVGITTAVGAFIGTHFAKKAHKDIECKTVIGARTSAGPIFPNNNDDDDKEKHPHGKYEDDGNYHKDWQSGNKSPRPRDGQEALDNSYKFNPNSDARVAIQDNEFVMLRPTEKAKEIFHGYRCSWKSLPGKAQTFLRKLGLVNSKGDIL